MMIIENKIIEFYYIIDEFSKKFDSEQTKVWKTYSRNDR